ncbi:uncharacterized protein C12orf50 homolog [Numenius arquata]|uniref:uncharacterized protein C12orf50 homolog n=1 Tax=Numenius arquata TaxID=31919 RepID=UPI003D30777C
MAQSPPVLCIKRLEEKQKSWKWPQLRMTAISIFIPPMHSTPCTNPFTPIFVVIFTISENICFLLQQKYRSISCFWETQPSGCVRISCAFHHTKPRTINGLFLPPSNNAPLQQGVQEEILQPTHCQESLRNQENVLRPIHPPLIINLDDEEDDEEEENYVSTWVPKSAADVEEERAIKEICYKSGEYYRIQYPHEHQSTKTVSSPQKNEVVPLVATEQDLQKGDGNRIPTKINNTKREKGSSGSRVPSESIPRTDCRSVENGGKYTLASASQC